MPVEFSSASDRKQVRDTWQSTSAGLVRSYQRAFANAADMLPVRRLARVDVDKDRFLTELGARADELHDELLRAMCDRAITRDPRELAELCEITLELQDIRSNHRQAVREERLRMLTVGQQVSARLSPLVGVKTLFERAATTMCDLPGIERSMVFHHEGDLLRAVATVFVDHDEWARDCQALSASTRYDLVPQRPEALMIRRRSPAIVTDALNDPNAFQPIVQKMQASNYVGAPVIADGDVVATIHGDAYFSDRPVDEVDRDVIASFAASLGQIVERAILIEQLQFQQRGAEQLARSAGRVLGNLAGGIPLLGSDEPAPIVPWQSRSEVVSDLTRREYEVLRLMTTGATNREIATSFSLSEETVKSHVKRILQKLGVTNRGHAVATYLESLEPVSK
ncbi:LuxR C-terminal-related transcriptional regulator [Nocardia sp. NEAU-G5]|uniref:LuxR C-terminal-related transcriptional regulator n=1 Tax=Nocardia albiluteola TaxID=2842303 RepID=A0ABS6AWJ7_9NOCA|nr:LuxR C-terminal-related transcriptional regulator [Nocardia albiluteola]MBU3062435.1 LuxR C-terminal-related transcriptional regulator [Nocardia albiluteola]